jgi:DNA-binding transcriptional ArsR family regulator
MDAFEVIGDPTRRTLIELLSEGEHPVGELVSHFDISFSAISQQLRILSESGIVTSRRQGRQRVYRLEPGALDPVAMWTAQYAHRFWERKLRKLGGLLERMKHES